jgi:hypothetical protein
MAGDTFELIIHDDETGEVLLYRRMTQEEAEQALVDFEFVKDRPHMALVRAVLTAGLYSINGRSVFAKRVPRMIED